MAARLEPIARPTIRHIADALQVTTATVSRALSGHPAISAATRQAVLRTAKKMSYHPNGHAASLRSGSSKIIGVIIPSAEIHFFGSVVHGIEKLASERGYTVLLYQSNEQVAYEKKGIATFLRSNVEGVIASVAKEATNLVHYKSLKRRGVPLVLFDRAWDIGAATVTINDYKGACMATQHLIEQGCRRIAHIAGPLHVPIFQQRLEGYKEALRKAGIKPDQKLVIPGQVSIESGHAAAKKLMALKAAPDGIFAVEDFTALGALQYLKERHMAVPQQVALAGFANEPFGDYITPSLTTVNQQTTLMGEEAARLFFRILENKSGAQKKPENLRLEPQLIVRQSSLRKTA